MRIVNGECEPMNQPPAALGRWGADAAAVADAALADEDGGTMRLTVPCGPMTRCSRSAHSAIGRSELRAWPLASTQA